MDARARFDPQALAWRERGAPKETHDPSPEGDRPADVLAEGLPGSSVRDVKCSRLGHLDTGPVGYALYFIRYREQSL
jgi:hypothetical protein